jgi:hypothetical protein
MMRNLPTLILSGILGSIVLVGNAEACHGKKCRCATPVVCAVVSQPAPCVQTVACVKPKRVLCVKALACPKPVVCARPVVCAKPVAKCGPKFKLCNFSLPTLCRKKPATCAAPVSYAVVYPAPQAVATPQQ